MTNNKQKKAKESYPKRTIRLSKETWGAFKDMRWESKENWEQFIKSLTKHERDKTRNNIRIRHSDKGA